jgi:hypothetical protein
MMSSAMQMSGQHVQYIPTSDTMNRHEYGITKNRKTAASTGGGRAWSEDEVRIPRKSPDERVFRRNSQVEALTLMFYRRLIFFKRASKRCRTSTLPLI